MLSEIDGQTAAQHRQATLLAEVADRHLLRATEQTTEASAAPGRVLAAIVRRLVGVRASTHPAARALTHGGARGHPRFGSTVHRARG